MLCMIDVKFGRSLIEFSVRLSHCSRTEEIRWHQDGIDKENTASLKINIQPISLVILKRDQIVIRQGTHGTSNVDKYSRIPAGMT